MTPVFYLFFDCVIIFCLDITFFQTISHLTNTVWLTFLRNPIIARDETYTSIFPALLEISKAKLFKVRQSFLTSYNSCKPTRFEVQCLFVAWLWECSTIKVFFYVLGTENMSPHSRGVYTFCVNITFCSDYYILQRNKVSLI